MCYSIKSCDPRGRQACTRDHRLATQPRAQAPPAAAAAHQCSAGRDLLRGLVQPRARRGRLRLRTGTPEVGARASPRRARRRAHAGTALALTQPRQRDQQAWIRSASAIQLMNQVPAQAVLGLHAARAVLPCPAYVRVHAGAACERHLFRWREPEQRRVARTRAAHHAERERQQHEHAEVLAQESEADQGGLRREGLPLACGRALAGTPVSAPTGPPADGHPQAMRSGAAALSSACMHARVLCARAAAGVASGAERRCMSVSTCSNPRRPPLLSWHPACGRPRTCYATGRGWQIAVAASMLSHGALLCR